MLSIKVNGVSHQLIFVLSTDYLAACFFVGGAILTARYRSARLSRERPPSGKLFAWITPALKDENYDGGRKLRKRILIGSGNGACSIPGGGRGKGRGELCLKNRRVVD